MSNERNINIPENEQEVKRKYRLNKRKFTVAIAVVCFVVAVIIIAAHYAGSSGQKEVIAAIEPPKPISQATGSAGINIDSKTPLEGKVIVVDAGHGGEDPGASGVNGSVEKELNLEIANSLKSQFESKGATVVMTRSGDKLADTKEQDWEERQEIISGARADILVSIHMNSYYDDTSVTGPLVMFLPGSVQGKALAEAVQQSMNDSLAPKNSGNARAEDLRILKYGLQPSVLVECGYISNAQEEEKLNTEDYQQSVAEAIYNGVIIYFASN